MARKLTTLSARTFLAAFAVHAVLLPVLYFGLRTLARADHEEVFIDHVRGYSRMYADVMEANLENSDTAEIVATLDSVVLGGRCTFAVLEFQDRRIASSILEPKEYERFIEDYGLGEHGDGVYYLSTPLRVGNEMALLKLGFDESATVEQLRIEERKILYVLGGYLLISLAFSQMLSRKLAEPLETLRRDSRAIASGDYTRKLTSSSDIDEISELATVLEDMRANLVGVSERLKTEIAEREAAEADKERMEGQLRHVQRLESIGTMAGGIAHEFNNILLPILLYTDLALDDLPEDSPVRGNLKRVMELANRAKGLSRQILTFGRQSSDSMRIALDIAPVVEEAVSMIRALVPANIEIRAEIEHNAGTVFCDASEIQQLVVNLCSNAYLALQGGNGYLAVSVSRQSVSANFAGRHPRLKEGQYVELKVVDNGVGMDAATVERVFEPFFTTRPVGKGTGLGLSVVHGIVTKHSGDVVVHSIPGNGTTVTVYFPIAGKHPVSGVEGEAA